ncbi:putative pectinesterase/pectinesterase inhibitor 45 [Dichanthelium oligosanthes]|uniref:pectinesterase n=1 Tax=Dichanthelium oligosanthes TaxID=888268 RepID=A0A1E5VVM9_9POAL|nr:putative pectinesterase/pectinesterase inhibitor 45 [Dichanthelium oligosanthes]
MANKVAVASVIAAVGIVAVIGTIAAVTASKKGSDKGGDMSAGVKLSTVCASTLYPEKCEQSLKPVVNDTSNPEDVLKAALNVALDEVAAAFERSAHIGKDAKDNLTRNAMDVCKKLLDDATEDLRDMARLKPMEVLQHVKDLRTWLSGVMTYIYTCADGFEKPELKEAMDKVLQNSTELSSNALAIITQLGELLPEQAKKLNATTAGHGRRLLGWQMGEAEEGTRGRRLLAVDDKLNEIADVTNASRQLLSDTLDEISAMSHGANRRLLGLTFAQLYSKDNGDPLAGRRHLLGMSFAVLDDQYDQRRTHHLSTQVDTIANTSAEANRHLLAAELPDELAGRRQLLSRTLMGINEVADEAKRQLEAIKSTMSSSGQPDRMLSVSMHADPEEHTADPYHRVLTTDLVGTFDEIADGRSGLPASDVPKWLPANQRRLLQLSGVQKPNAVVAQDGSGGFKTISEAINAAPKSYQGRYVIYVKAGTYKEYVTIPKDMTNVFMYGDGPTRTVVTGDKSNTGGFATIATRTFSSEGNGFICKNMGFVNTAGPEGHQAVAMHVQGDMSVFFNCRFEGYQDTLYVHANRQFFRNCEVLGTVDFIFGNSAALFQNCLMTVRKPGESQSNMVTAQGRTDPNMPTGIVLQSCRIVPEQALFPVRLQVASYLGRPWKEYARTVVMESTIGDLIKPEGWAEWMGDIGLKTLYYAEYSNTGPGAGTSKRVNWPGYRGVIGQAEATQFTAGVFIDGMTWLKATGTPNVMGFTK